jgi:ATP-dependent Clp protease ATP-binding subunit ClpC
MFERFSANARRAVVTAQEEAARLNHNYIGTEHLLLGLLRQTDGIAVLVLNDFGITLDGARAEVEGITGMGKSPAGKGHIPFTPRAKKVLELSLREALRLGHNYIGTEHILLGLIREGDGVAAKVLTGHAADLKDFRAAVIKRVPLGEGNPEERDPLAATTASSSLMRRIRHRFGSATDPQPGEEDIAGAPRMRATPAGDATLAEAARLAGAQALGSHHLLLAALTDANSAAALALTSLGVDLDQVREKLLQMAVEGTSDEQPEEAGRRQMALEFSDGVVRLVLTDPVIVAAGEAALRAVAEMPPPPGETGGVGITSTATVIRGDHPAATSLAAVWTALRESLEEIRATAATPPAA